MRNALTINKDRRKAIRIDTYIDNQSDIVNRYMFKITTNRLLNTIANDNLLTSNDIIDMIHKESILWDTIHIFLYYYSLTYALYL